MKTGAGMVVLSLGLAFLPGVLCAGEEVNAEVEGRGTKVESPAPPASKSKTRVQDQLNRLIREEAGIAGPVPAPEEGAAASNEEEKETLQLEPLTVEGKRELAWPPPLRENKVQEVMRTGTLWKKVGPRFTRRFWIKGDEGIGFSLSW
jgi:hypothetical protein